MPADLEGAAVVEVAASRDACLALLLAPEDYPRWYDTLDAVAVRARDREGRPAVVEFAVDLPAAPVRFALRYGYDLPGRIDCQQVEGDGRVRSVTAEWLLDAVAPQRTRVTYRFSALAGSRLLRLALRTPATRALAERDLVTGFPEALRREAEAAG